MADILGDDTKLVVEHGFVENRFRNQAQGLLKSAPKFFKTDIAEKPCDSYASSRIVTLHFGLLCLFVQRSGL